MSADLDRAISAAREALRKSERGGSGTWAKLEDAMADLLAALDAAQPVAVPDGYTSYGGFRWACDCDERMRREWIPLYLAPPAAVPALAEVLETLDRLHADHMRAGDYFGEGCYHTDEEVREIMAEYSAVRAVIERALNPSVAPPAAVPAVDAETLDFARNAARLLHGFMLDTNAVGAKEAGVNLARSIKANLAAANEENNP